MSIYTIGHSTHSPEQFATLMHAAGIDTAVDIRSHRSSHWDWWTEPNVQPWMLEQDLSYMTMIGLGGWTARHEPLAEWAFDRGVNISAYTRGHFPKQRIAKNLAKSDSPAWTNQGLFDYSWYMATEDFLTDLDLLVSMFGGPGQQDVAIFCSEAMWWKCHRSMVADAASYLGFEVRHVMPGSKKTPARVSLHNAEPRLPRYDNEIVREWEKLR